MINQDLQLSLWSGHLYGKPVEVTQIQGAEGGELIIRIEKPW